MIGQILTLLKIKKIKESNVNKWTVSVTRGHITVILHKHIAEYRNNTNHPSWGYWFETTFPTDNPIDLMECSIWVELLDSTVFSGTARATRHKRLFVLFAVIVEMSPRMQREGDNEMWQHGKRRSHSLMFFQKCLIGTQCQVEWM